MLVNWTLENFKSFGQKVTLPLSPITVLVGANSSGKSTIIQSILLIKQTIQHAQPEQPIALNGPLIKLGNFNDVKNVLSKGEGFRIGWEYNANFLRGIFPGLIDDNKLAPTGLSPYRTEVSNISWLAHFDIEPGAPKSELSLLQPSLTSCEVYAASQSPESPQSAKLGIVRPPETISDTLKRPAAPSGRPEARYYKIAEIDLETSASVLEGHPNGKIVGAVLRHFFPFYVAVEYDTAIRRATQIADAICSLRKSVRFVREYSPLPVPPKLLAIISEWLNGLHPVRLTPA